MGSDNEMAPCSGSLRQVEDVDVGVVLVMWAGGSITVINFV